MSKTVEVKSSTFPLAGILGIVFIVLKLTGVIDWSWLWVLSPFWIPVALWVGIFGIIAAVALIAGLGALVSGSKK